RVVQTTEGRLPPQPRGRGRPPDVEIEQWIRTLQGIWLDVFDGRFRTSRNFLTGRSTGPQVRFLHTCCQELSQRLQSGGDALSRFRGWDRPAELQSVTEALGTLTMDAIEHRARRSPWHEILRGLDEDPVLPPLDADIDAEDGNDDAE
ncbi:unnamed protein product, partial [marine sediment metagenome]